MYTGNIYKIEQSAYIDKTSSAKRKDAWLLFKEISWYTRDINLLLTLVSTDPGNVWSFQGTFSQFFFFPSSRSHDDWKFLVQISNNCRQHLLYNTRLNIN